MHVLQLYMHGPKEGMIVGLQTTCMFTLTQPLPPLPPSHAASSESVCSCMSNKTEFLWTGWHVTYAIKVARNVQSI